jgi:internalin A
LRRGLGDEYFQSIVHVSLYVDIKKGIADATWVNKGTADDALRKLTTQKQVRTLQIGGNQVTDLNLSYVGQITSLEELSIEWGFHLTDKGFLQLSGLRRLRILDIDNSKMTDTSLEAIGKLKNLEELRIGGEGFSDRGVEHLKRLTRLRYLSLGEGKHQISDAGLEFLKGMHDLEYINLGGWNVSDQGIDKLRDFKKLKTVQIGLSEDDDDRRKRLNAMLPGVSVD